MEQSRVAFNATAERLDTAIRAANPGMEHAPPIDVLRPPRPIRLHDFYHATRRATPEGQKPQVDLIGAKQSVDMLTVIAEKDRRQSHPVRTVPHRQRLFELRLAFLDVTQALSRSAAAKQPAPGTPGFGPSIVR